MACVLSQIAQLILEIETDHKQADSPRHLSGFETEPAKPAISFRFHPLDPSSLGISPEIERDIERLSHQFRCFNGHWGVPFLAAGKLRELLGSMQTESDSVSLELLDKVVRIQNFRKNTLDIFHLAQASADAIFTYKGEFYLAPFLSRFQAMILHGSCVVRNEKAVLFLGPDGAGKTTVATSQTSGPILCDDQVILRWEEGRFQAYGTPWGRIFQAFGSAPLGALILLEQADGFSLTPISPREMFTYIWDEHPYYHLPLPVKFRTQAFDLVHRLCRSIPLFRMRFGLRNIDWPVIDQVLVRLT
jgi:hypothetical protein